MTDEQLVSWWVRGGIKWVNFIEDMTGEGLPLDAQTAQSIRDIAERLLRVLEEHGS